MSAPTSRVTARIHRPMSTSTAPRRIAETASAKEPGTACGMLRASCWVFCHATAIGVNASAKPHVTTNETVVTFLFGYQASSFAIVRANHSMADPAAYPTTTPTAVTTIMNGRARGRREGVSAAK